MLETLETYIDRLRFLYHSGHFEREEIEKLGATFLWEEHELARAYYTALCRRHALPVPEFVLTPKKNGALPLFERGGFPWGSLPYPKEHAELAYLCFSLGLTEIGQKLTSWQLQHTLDHLNQPLAALFSQEGNDYASLFRMTQKLIESVPCYNLQGSILDEENGLVGIRDATRTIVSVGSGCKSGLGVFLYKDVGIVNFGPQFLPLGECGGFGIAGRQQFFSCEAGEKGFSHQFQTRLSAPHERQTGFSKLKDSGYSGLWIKTKNTYADGKMDIQCLFEGTRSLESHAFAFFGKGSSCIVAKSHKLQPRSLDRYQGPPQPVTLQGQEGRITVEALEGVKRMEIIPLAGGEHFWGSDFLIAYLSLSSPQQYTISIAS